jgi:hypothetical protein
VTGRTAGALDRLGRPLRRTSTLTWLAAGFALGLLVLAAGAWLLRLGVVRAAPLVLGTWSVVGLGFVLVAWLAVRERRRLAVPSLAEALEGAGVARRGALVALLDERAGDTSAGLLDLADAAREADVARRGAAGVGQVRRTLRRRTALLGVLALTGGVALARAGPSATERALLWKPAEAVGLLFAPVTLRADPDVVDRGGIVTLHLSAVGQRSATLWRRAPGQSWTTTAIALDAPGRATEHVGPVDSDLFFRLASGSRTSDTIRVRVRLPAFLGALDIVAEYPAYLGLEPEPVRADADTIFLPEGTTLATRGEASRALAAASWRLDERAAPLDTRGRQFSGRFVPGRSGAWWLDLRTADGAPLTTESPVLPIVLVPDSVPVVEVPVPGADTLAPVDLLIPLVIDARDDHGLTRVEVVSVAGTGAAVREPVPLAEGTPERALLQHVLDLGARGLAPGDTVRYWVQAWDTSPAGQSGRSREYVVLVPTAGEQRAARRETAREARRQLDSLVEAGRRLERNTEDLGRQRIRATGQAGGEQQRMSFDEARRAEETARSQEELLREAEALRETLEALEEAARRGETADTALARQLAEISEQLRRALSPELRERLAELQRAVQALDPEATRQALRDLAELQRQLREALERSRELFRRAALEGELAALAEDARDLTRAQAEWNERVAAADSARAAAEEQALAGRADSLAQGLGDLARELDSQRAREQMGRTADLAREAAARMRAAAGLAMQGRRQEARDQGQVAQASLERVQQETDTERRDQQEEWRRQVLDALDRALAETARLSRQQLAVADAYRADVTAAVRREQAMVEESAVKLVEQVTALAGQNALVSPRVAVALTVARRQMAAARDAVSTGSPNRREAGDRAGEAVDALNVAALALVRSREDVAGAASASGLAEAMERMSQLAGRQGQVSQEAGDLLPLLGSALLQEHLRQLALEQRALARELERLRAGGELPGTREMAEEARELARRLEAERLDPETVARQERLFRRMLDAGRTLQGEEEDEDQERRGEAARAGELHLPAALRRRLGEDAVRFPSWEELQRLSPEERRLVTEYFRRLAGSGAGGPP